MTSSAETTGRSVRPGPLGVVLGMATLLVVLGSLAVSPRPVAAKEPKDAATELSDEAFVLLNSLNGGGEKSKALLGPVAGFAGDAQTLSSALAGGNRAGAGRAMAALQSDRDAVDAAIKASPGVLNQPKWDSLKRDLDDLAKAVPPSASPSEANAGRSAGDGAERGGTGLTVKIESVTVDSDHNTHVKGWLRGRELKSAGVYSDERQIRSFKIAPAPGSLRIEFDIALEQVEPGTVIRVYDMAGHSAEAAIASGITAEPTTPAEGSSARPDATAGRVGESTAPEDDSYEAGGANTAEIPSGAPPSPSKRHVRSRVTGALASVRIQIENTMLVDPMLREYQISGQISGRGVERAAIFVDGQLAEEIPLDVVDGFGHRLFNLTFAMRGREATIRVYGAGDQYVENSIQMPVAVIPGPAAIPGYGANPYGYGVNPYGYGVNPYGYGGNPYSYGANPYGANPSGRPINPYGNANPGYNGYNMNGNAVPGYGNPYGNPYPNNPPPRNNWWQQLLR